MPMTQPEWATCVQILDAALTGEMTAGQIEIYHRILKDLPADKVKLAVYKLLAENKYLNAKRYPNPAEIREAVQVLMHGQFATAEEAFKVARAAVKRYGLDQSDKAHQMCGDTVWNCIRAIGGFGRLCDCSPDNLPAMFAQFRDAWTRYASTTQALESLPSGLRPQVVGVPAEKDVSLGRKAVELQLEKLGERVTLPLLEGHVEPIKRTAKREGDSQVVHESEVDSSLPMNPAPGVDISNGYYTSYTVRGERLIRFFSAELVARMIQESETAVRTLEGASYE